MPEAMFVIKGGQHIPIEVSIDTDEDKMVTILLDSIPVIYWTSGRLQFIGLDDDSREKLEKRGVKFKNDHVDFIY